MQTHIYIYICIYAHASYVVVIYADRQEMLAELIGASVRTPCRFVLSKLSSSIYRFTIEGNG